MDLVLWQGMGSLVRAARCHLCYVRGTKNGCCNWKPAWTLADFAYLAGCGQEEFIAGLLRRRDAEVRAGGTELKLIGRGADKCPFHVAGAGCALPAGQRPLLCRTYLCAPRRLLPNPRLRREYVTGYARTRAAARALTAALHRAGHDLEALDQAAFAAEAPELLRRYFPRRPPRAA